MPPEIKRQVIRLFVGLIFAAFAGSTWTAEISGTITGVVKTASGEAAVGSLVRVKHRERGLAFTVVSQKEGRYRVSGIPYGEYTAHATGGGYQSDSRSIVRLDRSNTATIDLTLNFRQSLADAMTDADYAALMPQDEVKDFIVAQCTLCHAAVLRTIVVARKTREEWRASVERMRTDPPVPWWPGLPNAKMDMTDDQAAKVVDYLARYFGATVPPPDVNRDLPKTWITGPASKYMITEYDLPPGIVPHDVAVDSKGIGWVGEMSGPGGIGRFDPQTLTYSSIPLPASPNGPKPSPHTLSVDPQNRVWTLVSNSLVQYDPKTGQFTIYPAPPNGRVGGNTLRFAPDGTVWMTGGEPNHITKLDPATKNFTGYPIPLRAIEKIRGGQFGMAIDGAGVPWFAEMRTNRVGRVDTKSGEIKEYDVPLSETAFKRTGSDADGNVWFGSYGGVGNLVKVDYRTTKITVFPTPTRYSGAYAVDADIKQNLIWVSEFLSDRIASFDPRTNRFIEYPLFTHGNQIRQIATDPTKPGRVWFCGYYGRTIGYLDVID